VVAPDILAERVAREGGSTPSTLVGMFALVSVEPGAGRHHYPIREITTAEALQKPVTNSPSSILLIIMWVFICVFAC
jgi:hypothetical protein